MAPDLNSVPPSPRPLSSTQSSTASSRRVSQPMAPPPVPVPTTTSTSSTMSSLPAQIATASYIGGATTGAGNDSAVGAGPGPIRHPRPLTAAELHLELEKEQEAVVNRLSRELSFLRQQTASVASTTSSTSTGLPESDPGNNHVISGPIHPTSSRRHRSSSNLSNQSTTIGGLNASAVSGIAPARDTYPAAHPRGQSSRHDSAILSRRSEASSPSQASPWHQGGHVSSGMASSHVRGSSSTRQGNRTASSSSTRYEEIAAQRAELEIVRRENENLRRRVQELERSLNSTARSQ